MEIQEARNLDAFQQSLKLAGEMSLEVVVGNHLILKGDGFKEEFDTVQELLCYLMGFSKGSGQDE